MQDRLRFPETGRAEYIKVRNEVEAAAALIAQVHSRPSLPIIDLRCTTELYQRGGYSPETDVDVRNIQMSILGLSPRLTFAHEWGHYIDNYMAGFNGWATKDLDLFDTVLRAIRETAAYQELAEIEQTAGIAPVTRRFEALRLLDAPELWARAYAQYIALTSQDPQMMGEVAARRADKRDVFSGLEYWDWSDFTSVAHAVSETMKAQGWR